MTDICKRFGINKMISEVTTIINIFIQTICISIIRLPAFLVKFERQQVATDMHNNCVTNVADEKLHQSHFESQRRKNYIASLRKWRAPKCIRDDMSWFISAYEKGELQEYEGKYGILKEKSLMKETFSSASSAATFLEKSVNKGLIIFVGPSVASLI